MAKWVYSFGDGKAEGRAEMRNLLGGKGANLAEMSSLGLPVPPGFTITTEVCTWYYANGNAYPGELKDEVEKALAAVEKTVGAGFGDANNPLLVSVRSGARASMPGMMDTVLNLGLNDRTVLGLGQVVGRRALRLGQLPPLHPDVLQRRARCRASLFRGGAGAQEGGSRRPDGHRSQVRRLALHRRQLQEDRREAHRQAVPAGAARAAVGRDRRGVQLVDEPARHHLPSPACHPRELGHRGQRAGHGVRQHGRGLRHRRRLHARSLDRRQPVLRRIPGERPGRGRGGRHPHAAASHGAGQGGAEVRCAGHGRDDARRCSSSSTGSVASSRSTIATCRTSSSPCSAASSTCCRRATASARPRPRSRSPSTWCARA